jgi:hypothetical protein
LQQQAAALPRAVALPKAALHNLKKLAVEPRRVVALLRKAAVLPRRAVVLLKKVAAQLKNKLTANSRLPQFVLKHTAAAH